MCSGSPHSEHLPDRRFWHTSSLATALSCTIQPDDCALQTFGAADPRALCTISAATAVGKFATAGSCAKALPHRPAGAIRAQVEHGRQGSRAREGGATDSSACAGQASCHSDLRDLCVQPSQQGVDWDQLSQELTAAGSPLQTVDKVSCWPQRLSPQHMSKACAQLTHKIALQALELFGDDVAIAFSGAEDVALVEYAHLTGRPYRVFRQAPACTAQLSSPAILLKLLAEAAPACSLDTGRLNPETYRLFQAVEDHYKIRIEYTFPDAQETMDLVRAKGMFSFYQDGHGECCRIRKVSQLPFETSQSLASLSPSMHWAIVETDAKLDSLGCQLTLMLAIAHAAVTAAMHRCRCGRCGGS